ncbi:DUF4352 domain-containing protein [Nocardia sp. NPDC050406]|uniref:DUF4352 domain-containing protein n=1 Tax=Nocardia sp. NPDC050406 TaxID=3364318 RepID=UPI0037905828
MRTVDQTELMDTCQHTVPRPIHNTTFFPTHGDPVTYPPQPPHGPQPPYSYPQYPMRPPTPPKSTVPIWVWILIGAFVLSCGGCAGLVGLASNETSKTKPNRTSTVAANPSANNRPATPAPTMPVTPPKDEVAAVGSAVRDGKFEFVVTRIEQGATSVGDGFWQADAKGVFVLVYVDVTNTGDRPQTYFGDNQRLIDDQEREFASNFDANAALNNYGFHDELNPGHKISVVLAFDLPVGTVPASIEFHDSMFSRGVKVAVQ